MTPKAPADHSLPPASSTFDDDFPATADVGNYTLHSPSYESEFPSLPIQYREQESVIHSISTAVHPSHPSDISATRSPVFRRPLNSGVEVDDISVEAPVPPTRKRFQESWEDSDLHDTSDD
jgi:hypothetical protein